MVTPISIYISFIDSFTFIWSQGEGFNLRVLPNCSEYLEKTDERTMIYMINTSRREKKMNAGSVVTLLCFWWYSHISINFRSYGLTE